MSSVAENEKRESTGGLAFEVVLKPATSDIPNITSPHKINRQISQEILEKKLKDAEERRIALEAEKAPNVAKRLSLAKEKVNSRDEIFSKEVKEKLETKLEKMEINKTNQIQVLQGRLKEHGNHVQEVRQAYEKSQAEYKQRLLQDITQKQEGYKENREKCLQGIKEKLEEHETHLKEVIQTSKEFSKNTEEKIIQKMDQSRINREKQLNTLMDRLKDHDEKVKERNRKSLNVSANYEDQNDENRPPVQ